MDKTIETMIRESNLIEGVRGQSAIQDSYRAWKYLTEQRSLYNVEQIEALHWIIMEKLLVPKERGRLRNEVILIGGHLAGMQPSLIRAALEKWLLDFPTTDPKDSHIRFEKIHPFIDGNGRTGRMIYYYQLSLLRDLSLKTIIYNDRKQAYYDWFKPSKSHSKT